ncbi:MAG TPA: cytochrome c family protein [Stellaceae bacterium]|nr:cytochrome c family protein [Stellaceae bacterium]
MSERFVGVLLALAVTALIVPAAHAVTGDPVRGAQIYQRCQLCHSIEHDLVGPRHIGLFGRKAGSIAGYPYSTAMKISGIVWSEDTLNKFLSGPQAFVPGTRMTFTGLPNEQDRADVIAYLKEATKPK